MLAGDLVQPLVLLAAVAALTPPLGSYVARVMTGRRTFLHPVLGPGPGATAHPGSRPRFPW